MKATGGAGNIEPSMDGGAFFGGTLSDQSVIATMIISPRPAGLLPGSILRRSNTHPEIH